jgi:hypothetical protein
MLRMIDRHAVQQMLTAGVRIGEVVRYFEVSRRTIERIRKEPRRAMGLKDRELSGPMAVEYLERVIHALEQEAAHAARFGWGRYRSLWYLRRLPMEFFAGARSISDIDVVVPENRSVRHVA